MDSSICTGASFPQTSVPPLGDLQMPSIIKQEEDDSEPIYLDFNFMSAQQNVDLNAQQQFQYLNNNTLTSELFFNSIYGNINSQAEINLNMVKPKRRGRPPNRKTFVQPKPIYNFADYEIPIVSENSQTLEPPAPPEPIIFRTPAPDPVINETTAPAPVTFETIIVCPPKQTKLSVRQMSNTNPVVTPVVPRHVPKLCRKQQLKLRPDDEFEILVEILDISNPIASSPERTIEVVLDHELTETPVRPSKRFFQQRRLLSMINKTSTVINSESLSEKNSNCIKQAKSNCDSHKQFKSDLLLPQPNFENSPEEYVLGLEKEIGLKKERKPNGRVNINKKRKFSIDDKLSVKKNAQYKGRDKGNCEAKDIGKRRKTSQRKTINP